MKCFTLHVPGFSPLCQALPVYTPVTSIFTSSAQFALLIFKAGNAVEIHKRLFSLLHLAISTKTPKSAFLKWLQNRAEVCSVPFVIPPKSAPIPHVVGKPPAEMSLRKYLSEH